MPATTTPTTIETKPTKATPPLYPEWMTRDEFEAMLNESTKEALSKPRIPIEDIITDFTENYAPAL